MVIRFADSHSPPVTAPSDTGNYTVRRAGHPYSKDYRVWLQHNSQPISAFHDIPLFANKEKTTLRMVVEVPKWSNAKFEISRSDTINPIVQNVKTGLLRFTKNCFPYRGYLWNYGALPQTWEDSHHIHPDTGKKGDNDPLDAIEIGREIGTTGQVKKVKALGVLPLVDSGESDWKVLVIDIKDPLAGKLNDITDVEEHLPGLLDATRDWFRVYKVPDGKQPNKFALGGKFQDKEYAYGIIDSCAEAWQRLISGKAERGDISIKNTSLDGTPGKIDPQDLDLPPDEELPPADIKQDLDQWYFVSRDD